MAWSFLADAAVSEVADRNRLSLVAARMGLKVGNLSAAFDLVARVLGEEPDNVQALAILVDCALATNNPRLCYEALHQLALSAPMAPSITRAQDGAAIRIDKSLAAWQRRPIEVPVGQPFSLAGHVPEGEIAGFGWSGTEGWGAWTDSAYARLDFTFAKPQPGPLRLRMQTRADASCALGDQKVRVFADNGFAGLFMVRRQEDSSLIEFELPAAATPRGTLALDFFISDPAPVRNAAGDYVDQRPLGIAMQRITIDPVK
ncbi:MAG: hypothetical protein JKY97_11500 [Citromicrobium sp.]|nr:hypothetical protein [Citromicrobium sp.]